MAPGSPETMMGGADAPSKSNMSISQPAALYGAVAESSSLASSGMKSDDSRGITHNASITHAVQPRPRTTKHQVELAAAEESNRSGQDNSQRMTRRRENFAANKSNRRRSSNPKLSRAVRFLTNPSVVNLPLDDKIGYLRSKGLSNEEVDEALDMVELENDEMDVAWDDNDSDGENERDHRNDRHRDRRRRQRGQYADEYGRGQPYQQHQAYQPSSQQVVSYADNNQAVQPYQQQTPQQQQQQQALTEPGLALPLTVGGILGVTAIAAFRWLNGGDFLLFPPPSAPSLAQDESHTTNGAAGGVKFKAGGDGGGQVNTGNETTVDSTIEEGYEEEEGGAALTQVEEEVEGGEHTTNEQDETIYDYLDEYLGNGEEEEEAIGGGGGAATTANDTTYDEDERYHTADYTYESGAEPTTGKAPPDIANRLENLTSAVEKFVAVQERTLKAKADEKGQAVTNSAMDLLRRSSSVTLSTPAVTPFRNGELQLQQPHGTPRSIGGDSDGSVPDVAVAVLVTKMKCQLIGVREAIKDAAKSGSSSTSMERAEEKLDEVTKTFERLETMLLGGKQVSDYETSELPVAANVASMYETPSRMFETGELSPVPGCNDGDDPEVTDLDVTLDMEMSPDRSVFGKEEEQNAVSAAAAAVAAQGRALKPPTFEVEDLGSTPEEPIGMEALTRAFDILTNPAKNQADTIKACAQMLYLYVVNLSSNASSKRYRRVYTTNANFKNKVGSVVGGITVLESLGFVDKGSYMEWEGDLNVPEGTDDQDFGIALLNHAAAQLSVLKVTGTRGDGGQSTPVGRHTQTPRQRCETPAPPGAPPRPTTINNSDSAGSAGSASAGSVATASTNAAMSVTSPSGFVTPRMRNDGNDRFLASPADSLASTNILASPPVIKQIPSRQDGAADELFGKDQEAKVQEMQQEDLGFPPAPSPARHSRIGRMTPAADDGDGGIFRTTRKILPPRAPSRGPTVDIASDFDSMFGLENNRSAFMRRAGSNMSAQSEPNFDAGGLGVNLSLRRSPTDDAGFAQRRNSDPFASRAGESKVSSAPVSQSHSPTKDQGKPMYFNLADMAVNSEDGNIQSPGASVESPNTLDYTTSPLNTSLLSGCPDDATEADSTAFITEVGMTPARAYNS